MGYKTIRQANDLIANLPAYVGKLKGAESWIAGSKVYSGLCIFCDGKTLWRCTYFGNSTGND